MTIKEKEELCSKAFLAWMVQEDNNNVSIGDEEISEMFTSKVILKKFEVFDIDIVLPDMLLFILTICTECNPGQFQVVLKDLLNSIKRFKGPIKPGYIITTEDFSFCFMISFPIMEIPKINKKYEELWDGQKKPKKHNLDSDNLCDTPEWWKEVMR